MLGMAIGVYGSFVVSLSNPRVQLLLTGNQVDVIVTICDYLDIWCLTIKHPWNEEEEAKKAKKAQ